MSVDQGRQREFTGYHMLFAMVAFFGVVIAVNITLAFVANSSWTGFVVENSYVASQHFNEKLVEGREQAALGWISKLTVGDGRITFSVADEKGRKVWAKGGEVVLRRPAYASEDETVQLVAAKDGSLYAEHVVRDGLWIIDVSADVGRDRPYRDGRRITVVGGKQQ
jgi:nitrogen fixation protein FixH